MWDKFPEFILNKKITFISMLALKIGGSNEHNFPHSVNLL